MIFCENSKKYLFRFNLIIKRKALALSMLRNPLWIEASITVTVTNTIRAPYRHTSNPSCLEEPLGSNICQVFDNQRVWPGLVTTQRRKHINQGHLHFEITIIHNHIYIFYPFIPVVVSTGSLLKEIIFLCISPCLQQTKPKSIVPRTLQIKPKLVPPPRGIQLSFCCCFRPWLQFLARGRRFLPLSSNRFAEVNLWTMVPAKLKPFIARNLFTNDFSNISAVITLVRDRPHNIPGTPWRLFFYGKRI